MQWARLGVKQGAYLTVTLGIATKGRGMAFVLSTAVPASGGVAQQLMLFRSANADWGTVDDRTIAIDSATQRLELAEGSHRLDQTGYAEYSGISSIERGLQPGHMSASFVEYLESKILRVALGEEQSGEGALISQATFANATIHDALSVGGEGGFSAHADGGVLGKTLNLNMGGVPEADTKYLKLFGGPSNATVFSVSGAGHIAAKKVTVTSDCRLKRNIAIEDGGTCMRQLGELDCLSYNFAEDPEKRLRGVSAQAVREVCPDLVTEDPASGTLSVDYSGLAALLVSGLNELALRQAQLEERVGE